VARHIFQACPVWIYTQSNITSIIKNMCFPREIWMKSHIKVIMLNYIFYCIIFIKKWWVYRFVEKVIVWLSLTKINFKFQLYEQSLILFRSEFNSMLYCRGSSKVSRQPQNTEGLDYCR
jgi:hypothetical protein